MTHASDSTEQQAAESYILQALEKKIGIPLEPKELRLSSKTFVQVDGVNVEEKVLCEIYVRIGKIKGSQPYRVGANFLKMLLVEETLGGKWQKHFCFASEEAAARAKGHSWLAMAATKMGIEIHVFSLPPSMERLVKAAQKRQVMANKN